jgi:N-acetylmuramoyl-L-alanine amidase
MIQNHLLKGAPFIQPPNYSKAACSPRWLAVHFTAGPDYLSTYYTFTNKNIWKYSQLVIDKDGDRYQFGPFNRQAWALGAGCYWGGKMNIEGEVINVELVGMGWVYKLLGQYGRWFGWPTYRFITVDPARIIQAKHYLETSFKYWVNFPQAQIDSLFDFARDARKAYGLVDAIGHEVVQIQKVDPGPLFPMAKLRKEVFGVDDAMPRLVARSGGVHLHIWASESSAIMPGSWAERGARVIIRDRLQRWVRVEVTDGHAAGKSGWIMERELDVGG